MMSLGGGLRICAQGLGDLAVFFYCSIFKIDVWKTTRATCRSLLETCWKALVRYIVHEIEQEYLHSQK